MSSPALALVPPPERSLSLYELSGELQALLDTRDLVAEGSAEQAELDALVQQFEVALPRKVDGVCKMLSHLESQAALAKAEAGRLTKRQKHFEAQAAALEGYCVRVLDALPDPERKKDKKRLEGESNTLTLTSSERCIIEKPELVPIEYKTAALEMPAELWAQIIETLWPESLEHIQSQISVRLADVKKALKAGAEIAGADIEYPKGVRRS